MIWLRLLVLFAVLLPLAPEPVVPDTSDSVDVAVFAFKDLNGDGAYGLTADGMEPSLEGVAVQLLADHEPLQSRGPEDSFLLVKSTNVDGFAVFQQLAPGSYILYSSLTVGYLPTTPREQYVTASGAGGATVLEYLFGQLQRDAFIVSFIFPMTHTGPWPTAQAEPALVSAPDGAPPILRTLSIATDRETRIYPRRDAASQSGRILEP